MTVAQRVLLNEGAAATAALHKHHVTDQETN